MLVFIFFLVLVYINCKFWFIFVIIIKSLGFYGFCDVKGDVLNKISRYRKYSNVCMIKKGEKGNK